jgi:hypothetical protein
MRQPYETLFGAWREHWLLGPHLQGDVPDWEGIMDARQLDSLSSGEITLLWIGLAIWNGDRTATIADLAKLDRNTRLRALAALGATV